MINFLKSLNARDPNHDSIGLFDNFFPDTGTWAVNTISEGGKNLELINLKVKKRKQYKYPLHSLEKGVLHYLVSHEFYTWLLVFFVLHLLMFALYIIPLGGIYQVLFVLLLLGFLCMIVMQDFQATKWSWGATKWSWRVIWSSILFSFDELVPIINLDENLQQFIFDDAEGFTRVFFLIQKLMAAVLASILLPIFFVTGL